jgi:hypothetical protein
LTFTAHKNAEIARHRYYSDGISNKYVKDCHNQPLPYSPAVFTDRLDELRRGPSLNALYSFM